MSRAMPACRRRPSVLTGPRPHREACATRCRSASASFSSSRSCHSSSRFNSMSASFMNSCNRFCTVASSSPKSERSLSASASDAPATPAPRPPSPLGERRLDGETALVGDRIGSWSGSINLWASNLHAEQMFQQKPKRSASQCEATWLAIWRTLSSGWSLNSKSISNRLGTRCSASKKLPCEHSSTSASSAARFPSSTSAFGGFGVTRLLWRRLGVGLPWGLSTAGNGGFPSSSSEL
eukprot:scaffold20903_cov99-Isochrysis_galbana.AAC.10